jgi:hypothetical protein
MLRRILIIIGYTLLVLAISAITVALVAYGNDYVYDFGSQKLIQKGHVIIESEPSGGQITADGKQIKKKTPYRAAFKVGDHTFKITKDGFRPWEKVLHVVAGRVALANYVILLPDKIEETRLDSRPQIISQAISKDHRHIAYITGGTDAGVYVLDPGSKKTTRIYSPQAATETNAAEVLQEVSWSDDASHLLIASVWNGQPQHRLATAGGEAAPIDLTGTYGFNFSGLKFSGSNWRQLYWVSPDGLRRLDVEAKAVSGVLADNVTQFWVQPDRVLYAQKTAFGRSLWSLDRGGKRQEVIQVLAESDTYSVALSRYDSEDYLAVVPAKTGVATLYSGVFGDTPVAKVLAHNVTEASFSPGSRYLAVTGPDYGRVYDLELSKVDNRMVIYDLPDQPGNLQVMTWYDDSHILSNRDGKLYWSEFDGANSVSLGDGEGKLPAYNSPDGRLIYVYRPVDTGVQIKSLKIR